MVTGERVRLGISIFELDVVRGARLGELRDFSVQVRLGLVRFAFEVVGALVSLVLVALGGFGCAL